MSQTTSTGLTIEHIQWSAAPLHIPDDKGGAYKTELVIHRSPERTEKINWWHGPDPRREPHNHPWPFRSTILAGGYAETRWTQVDGVWTFETVTYQAGGVNDLPVNVYHTVDSVRPGTVTHMVCGPIVSVNWGYLIDGKKQVIPADDDFLSQLRAINPHKR